MSRRILSLLPAATEIVYLLGAEGNLVGVSHNSDYPKQVEIIPKVTSTFISQDLSSKEIDGAVKEHKHQGSSVFHIDQKLLHDLHPDVILTQELCSVCAVSYSDVTKAAKVLTEPNTLISLEPESVDDILDNIRTVASYTGKQAEAARQVRKLQKRITDVKRGSKSSSKRPTVFIIEWMDPIMVAGHWIPQMIEAAGGDNLLTKTGEKSIPIGWQDVVRLDPDHLIIAPCGFDLKRTKKELQLIIGRPEFASLKAHKNNQVFLVDGNAFLTRPGPRVVDGIEIFAEILYPQAFPRRHPKSAWQHAL